MKPNSILLTGSTGTLGKAILSSNKLPPLLAFSKETLDITNPSLIADVFKKHNIEAVIHCAAMARMSKCEKEPIQAVNTNIIGTCNLINAVINKEKSSGKNIRFIHISTDGVYAGDSGSYSENDATIPYNKYGWTKLGAECAVNLLSNFCIIRTSFFDPENISFTESADDAFSSKLPIKELVHFIACVLESKFNGTLNIGDTKKSDYDRYRHYKPDIKPCKLNDITANISFPLAKDASLDLSLWKQIKKDGSYEKPQKK